MDKPRACLFWNERVLHAYAGISLLLSRSSSSSPASSVSDSPSLPTGKICPLEPRAMGVSPSFACNKSFRVAQTCHFAARHVTDCALCVILVALRNKIKSPTTSVIEQSCKIKKLQSHQRLAFESTKKKEVMPLAPKLQDNWWIHYVWLKYQSIYLWMHRNKALTYS